MCLHTNGINSPSEDLARSRINYVKQYFSNTLSYCRQCIFLDIRRSRWLPPVKSNLSCFCRRGQHQRITHSENAGKSWHVLTVVQIGLNAVAILAVSWVMQRFLPAFYGLFVKYMSVELAEQLSFILLLPGDRLVHFVRGFDPETHRYDCARSCGFAYHQPDALLPLCLPSAGVVL